MTTERTYGVYLIQNRRTLETYVGSGKLEERAKNHPRLLQKNQHFNPNLQAAFNRDPNFEFISVPMDDREEAYDLEQAIINEFYGHPLFLNASRNARFCVREWTEQERLEHGQRMSEQGRRYYASLSDEERAKRIEQSRQANLGNTYSVGRTHRSESIEKMSQSRKEVWATVPIEERRRYTEKASAARLGISVNSQAVIIDGRRYESQTIAANELGLSIATISNRINSTDEKWKEWKRA